MVIRRARSSRLASIRSNHLRSLLARSLAVRARQAGSALSAASMARRVSLAPIFGTLPMISPVAGLLTLRVWPLSASTQAPSI
ncbi:hypothetical protein D3C84_1108440 [compost metagenome]